MCVCACCVMSVWTVSAFSPTLTSSHTPSSPHLHTLTNDKGHGCLHVAGEGEGTHWDVSALPGEGEDNGSQGLPDTGEEGRTGGVEDNLLLQEEKGEERDAVVSVQGEEE